MEAIAVGNCCFAKAGRRAGARVDKYAMSRVLVAETIRHLGEGEQRMRRKGGRGKRKIMRRK